MIYSINSMDLHDHNNIYKTLIPSFASYMTPNGRQLAKKYSDKYIIILNTIFMETNLKEEELLKGKGIGIFQDASNTFYYYIGKNKNDDEHQIECVDTLYPTIGLDNLSDRYFVVNVLISNKELIDLKAKDKNELSWIDYPIYILRQFGISTLKILINEKEILNEEHVKGVGISGSVEDMTIGIYLKKEDIKSFFDKKITFLELLSKSSIDGWIADVKITFDGKDVVSHLIFQ